MKESKAQMQETIQKVGQAHKCAPERCGTGGKSYLHLTGGHRFQLAPQVRRRRVQRKRSVNKIRASDFRAETWTKGSY